MPSCGDYIMHFLTLPWKLIFAFIPPTGKNGIVYTVHIDSRYTRIYSSNHNTSFSPKVAFQNCINAYHINILDLCYINFINMRRINITLGGSRKVKVGLRENVYLHLDTWRYPCLCIPSMHVPTAAISSKTVVASSLEYQDPISFSIDLKVPNNTRQKVLE